MTWQDRLLDPSFRGIRFETRGHDAVGGGRRGPTHQYPGRDTPYGEDLGRVAQEFEVDAYIVGDDYMVRRDLLQAACNRPGPGTLIHPYLGAQAVICRRVQIVETSAEGRMARLRMRFTEAGTRTFPASLRDTLEALLDVVATGDAALVDDFADAFDLGGIVASYVREELTETVDELFARLPDIPGIPLPEGQGKLGKPRDIARRAVAAIAQAGRGRVRAIVQNGIEELLS